MLHVAEKRAAELFEVHCALNADDPRTHEMFEEILRDEKYHIAYTKTFLDKWRKQGRGVEVDKALKSARGSRLMGAWKRLGVRSAAGFSQAVLFVLYWTVLAPFGLLTRGRRNVATLQAPRVATSSVTRLGQY
jgi:hypothetical protein